MQAYTDRQTGLARVAAGVAPLSDRERLGVCHRFVEGSIGYLSGLVSAAELIPLARQHRDRMLAKVRLPP